MKTSLRASLKKVSVTALTPAILLTAITETAIRAQASESQQIYILSEQAESRPGVQSQPYALKLTGSVPGAARLAVPESGRHLLVLTREGKVWSWDAPIDAASSAWVEVGSLDSVASIAAGAAHSVALKGDGTVWTWGANQQGQLGSGSLADRMAPGSVTGLDDVRMIAAGTAFTLALRGDGTVWAFGTNWTGIAPGVAQRILMSPVKVSGLAGIETIAVSRDRGYAKDSQGRIWVWGGSEENSSITALSADEASGLSAEVLRDLGNQDQAVMQSEWHEGSVRIAGASIDVQKKEMQSRFTFEGGVIDVDWGWAVGVITGAQAEEAASSGEGSSSARTRASAKNSAADRIFASGGGREAAAPQGTITAGEAHSIALNNAIACAVGTNGNGQLGDGTAVDRMTPVRVHGNYAFSRVSTGWYHSIGLKTDGTVLAWGDNGYGQLGDGTSVDKPTPVRAGATLSGVTSVAAGRYHSVAARNDGTVWAWGYNGYGNLGDGSKTQRTVPVQAILISGVIAVAAGEYHTLALKGDGTVWAWGYNGNGQLGDGSTTERTTAVQVGGLTGIIRIAAGSDHNLALKSDGTLWAWGYNGYGQLGDGSTTSRTLPVAVSSLTGVVDMAGGDYHSLAVKADGTAWGWGYNNYGALGNASTVNSSTPVQVAGFTGATAVAAGQYHSIALKSDGTLWSWGRNNLGQLGNGSTTDSVIATAISPCSTSPDIFVTASPWSVRITASQSHGHAIQHTGQVISWGENDNGTLGDGTTAARLSPVPALVADATQVSAGWAHGLALKKDRSVWAWGTGSNGQLGDGTTASKPVPIRVTAISGAVAVAAGRYHSLALKSDGIVWAWGYNSSGQIGDGSNTQRTTPVQTIVLTGVTAIAAGENHSLALKGDGTVWAWGYNGYGQLGNGTTTNSTSAVQVQGLTDVIAIAAGHDFSLALRRNGTVWGSGYNGYGNLGDGSTSYRTTVVRASDLSGVIAIAAGDYHSLAVRSDGTVWGWGYNQYGTVGDGTTTHRHVPVQASGINGALAVAAGEYFSIALKNDGTVLAWGRNNEGQFGNGGTNDSTVPVSTLVNNVIISVPRPALKFVPVTPCRIADTRNPSGPFGGPAISASTARSFAIPSSACGIPATASAYSVNVTVVPRGLLGYVTLYPTGQPLPLASTLNSLDGRVKANAAIVPAGDGKAVSVYATHTTDVILDINGYFVDDTVPATKLAFFPLTPCRVADTRGQNGSLGGPFLPASQERSFPVRSTCSVPANAQAYSLNFTAVPRGTLGYITTWPTGVARPLVSTLNAIGGQVTANAAIVPAGTNGNISVFAANNTDLVIDINGYFAPAGAGGLSLYSLAPCRVLDTREPAGSPAGSGVQTTNVASSLCGAAANARAYVLSATVVPPGLLGYVSLWPQGEPQPLVSTLNSLDGAVTSNMAIVPTNNGGISWFSDYLTHLILDISGYFAP